MYRVSEGIVLRVQPYQDNKLIATLFTREYGRVEGVFTVGQSARQRARGQAFQPASCVELTYAHRDTRTLQTFTEVVLAVLLPELQSHPVKALYVSVWLEVFAKCVQDQDGNPQEVYDLLKTYLIVLHELPSGFYPLTLHFLVQLSRLQGFAPSPLPLNVAGAGPWVFSPSEGLFLPARQVHSPSVWLNRVLTLSMADTLVLNIPKSDRKALLDLVLAVYRQHIEHLEPLHSMRVFEAVFRT
jgi:DNA repair protein RecO (recombination protein O)